MINSSSLDNNHYLKEMKVVFSFTSIVKNEIRSRPKPCPNPNTRVYPTDKKIISIIKK